MTREAVGRHAWRGPAILVLVTVGTVLAVEAGLRLVGLGTPILYESRAAYGYRPCPDQTRRRLRGATVHVNHLGLRGPDVTATRPPGALRILFLGDSVTWGGSYVDDRDLFAAVAADTVQERLPGRFTGIEALDGGVNAWGPQNVLGLVRESGGFESQLWVWTLLEDDFGREKTHFGEVPYFGTAPWSAWEELVVLAAYKVVTAYKVPKPAGDLAAIAAENLTACRGVAEAARAAGARLVLVWHPTAAAVTGASEPHAGVVGALAAGGGLAFLDLTAAYRGTPRTDALYVDGMHLSIAGHRVVGRAVGERLAALLETATP